MKATLSNQIHLSGLTLEQAKAISKSLTFANPKYREAQQQGRSTYDTPRMLELFEIVPGGLVVPRGVSLSDVNEIDDQRNTHSVEIMTRILTPGHTKSALSDWLSMPVAA